MPDASAGAHHRGPPGDADGGAGETADGGAMQGEKAGSWRHFDADLRRQFRAKKPDLAALKQKLQERRAARDARRHEAREALIQRWGSSLAKPDVEAELKRHASCQARLERLEELAATEKTGEERDKLLAKIENLRTREALRHERAMRAMATPAGADAGAAAPSAAPDPSSAPVDGGTP